VKASINTNAVTKELTITSQGLNWDDSAQAPFYEGEVQVRDLLKVSGQALTVHLRRSKAGDAPTVKGEGETYSRQETSLGHYQPLYGEVVLSRQLYQSSAGGAPLCPLARHCQLRFGAATPWLAAVGSFTRARAPAGEVAQDLAKSHGLALSATYWHHRAHQVGQLAVEKHAAGHWHAAAAPAPVALSATGVEGTTRPLVNEADKEARGGTVALDDQAGQRLPTEYLGTRPEAGKATLAQRFTPRVTWVKACYPNALHVGLGDGAPGNWDCFATHYPEAVWVLDFSHAATPLHTAAAALCGRAQRPRPTTSAGAPRCGTKKAGGRVWCAPASTTGTGPPCRPVPSARAILSSTTSARMPH